MRRRRSEGGGGGGGGGRRTADRWDTMAPHIFSSSRKCPSLLRPRCQGAEPPPRARRRCLWHCRRRRGARPSCHSHSAPPRPRPTPRRRRRRSLRPLFPRCHPRLGPSPVAGAVAEVEKSMANMEVAAEVVVAPIPTPGPAVDRTCRPPTLRADLTLPPPRPCS